MEGEIHSIISSGGWKKYEIATKAISSFYPRFHRWISTENWSANIIIFTLTLSRQCRHHHITSFHIISPENLFIFLWLLAWIPSSSYKNWMNEWNWKTEPKKAQAVKSFSLILKQTEGRMLLQPPSRQGKIVRKHKMTISLSVMSHHRFFFLYRSWWAAISSFVTFRQNLSRKTQITLSLLSYYDRRLKAFTIASLKVN